MDGVVPESPHEAFHANAPIRILLPAMGAKLCLVGQWMVAVTAIAFHERKLRYLDSMILISVKTTLDFEP